MKYTGKTALVGGLTVGGAMIAAPAAATALSIAATGPVAGGLFASAQAAGYVTAGGALATA